MNMQDLKPFIPLPDEQKDRSSDDSTERGAVIKGETEEKFYNMDVLIKIRYKELSLFYQNQLSH